MTIRLTHIRDTAKAALYRFSNGLPIWIPLSVLRSRVKFPSKDPLDHDVHELSIEDWWWEKWEGDNDEEDSVDWSQ